MVNVRIPKFVNITIMNEFELLKKEVQDLRKIINFFVLVDRYQFQRDIELLDGRNIRVSQVTGLKIGTAITQKIGIWNQTPISQPTNAAQAAVATAAATQTTPWGFSTQAQADGIITLLNRIRLDLVNIGLIKGS